MRNIIVRYAGETARLDREALWKWRAFWRCVRFVSSRDGRIAQGLDAEWQRRYGRAAGGVPPLLQMPLADAIKLLGVPANYTKEDVEAAFRREAKKAHPDVGGTAEQFRNLVEARDRLLAALGTSAPPPKHRNAGSKCDAVAANPHFSRAACWHTGIRRLSVLRTCSCGCIAIRTEIRTLRPNISVLRFPERHHGS